MAIRESIGLIGATLVAMVHTRLELAAVELQEESQRVLGYLMLALASLLLFGIAMLLVALLVIVVFWDSYRIEAVAALTALFGLAATLTALSLRSQLRNKPRLLAATVGELAKDVAYIQHRGQVHEQ